MCVQDADECPSSWPRHDPPVTAATVQAMLDEFVSVLSSENLVTPDTLRGDYPTVQAALEGKGPETFWPDIDSIRGKFIIVGAGMAFLKNRQHFKTERRLHEL